MIPKTKLTIEFVREKFLEKGFKLISTEYKRNDSKLNVICPNGHELSIQYAHFRNGIGCKKCSNNSLKKDYNLIKLEFEKIGWKLISKEYISAREYLEVECNNNHRFKIVWNAFQQGVRCSICSNKPRRSYIFVKEALEKEGWELISKSYSNTGEKLDVKCPFGHFTKLTWDSFKSKKMCGYCSGRYATDKNSLLMNYPDIAKEYSKKMIKI